MLVNQQLSIAIILSGQDQWWVIIRRKFCVRTQFKLENFEGTILKTIDCVNHNLWFASFCFFQHSTLFLTHFLSSWKSVAKCRRSKPFAGDRLRYAKNRERVKDSKEDSDPLDSTGSPLVSTQRLCVRLRECTSSKQNFVVRCVWASVCLLSLAILLLLSSSCYPLSAVLFCCRLQLSSGCPLLACRSGVAAVI